MALSYANWNCNRTAIATAGTTTIDPGATGGGNAGSPLVFYGAISYALGTSPTVAVYDITASGTNTLLATGTFTAVNQAILANSGGPGPRLKGALVVVTTGTNAGTNVLWD